MANSDVRDVAASANPVLKVKGDSKPNSVAGAICNVVRESAKGNPPAVVATGPNAINQAMKAIAIARTYLKQSDAGGDSSHPDLTVYPEFVKLSSADQRGGGPTAAGEELSYSYIDAADLRKTAAARVTPPAV